MLVVVVVLVTDVSFLQEKNTTVINEVNRRLDLTFSRFIKIVFMINDLALRISGPIAVIVVKRQKHGVKELCSMVLFQKRQKNFLFTMQAHAPRWLDPLVPDATKERFQRALFITKEQLRMDIIFPAYRSGVP